MWGGRREKVQAQCWCNYHLINTFTFHSQMVRSRASLVRLSAPARTSRVWTLNQTLASGCLVWFVPDSNTLQICYTYSFERNFSSFRRSTHSIGSLPYPKALFAFYCSKIGGISIMLDQSHLWILDVFDEDQFKDADVWCSWSISSHTILKTFSYTLVTKEKWCNWVGQVDIPAPSSYSWIMASKEIHPY